MQLAPPASVSSLRTLLLAGLVALGLTACGQDDDAQQGPPGAGGGGERPPPAVSVISVEPRDVEVVQEYAGRARGSREVEVQARVGGTLQERLYVEGQRVEEGESLFRIDPEPYQIALRRAEAERANARAELNQARREWQRISSLYEQNAVSERERDQALSARELAEARYALAEAGVAEAQLNLDYTQVAAPIAGITGLETLPEGSLIDRGTLLTTLTQQDPVHVRFALPENDAALQRTARRAMVAQGDETPRQATLVMTDGREYSETGQVDFTASTIDPRTGSVTARAVFPNPDGTIVPGQFVRVRIEVQQLENAFLIPPQAVGQGPEGPQVFVVDDEGRAESRVIRLGPVQQSRQIVTDGLEPGDRVVVNGQVALRDGAQVNASEVENAEEALEEAEESDETAFEAQQQVADDEEA